MRKGLKARVGLNNECRISSIFRCKTTEATVVRSGSDASFVGGSVEIESVTAAERRIEVAVEITAIGQVCSGKESASSKTAQVRWRYVNRLVLEHLLVYSTVSAYARYPLIFVLFRFLQQFCLSTFLCCIP